MHTPIWAPPKALAGPRQTREVEDPGRGRIHLGRTQPAEPRARGGKFLHGIQLADPEFAGVLRAHLRDHPPALQGTGRARTGPRTEYSVRWAEG